MTQQGAASQQGAIPGPRLIRRAPVVLTGLLSAFVVLVSASRPWVEVDLTGVLAGTPRLDVGGADAVPAVPALALVGLAGAAAVSIAGNLGRRIAGGVVVLAGLAATAATGTALADPSGTVAASVAAGTGGTGAAEAARVALTPWPVVTAGAAVALAGCGVLVLTAGRRWAGGRRFETPLAVNGQPASAPDPRSDWDALSSGADPTSDGTEHMRR